MKSHSRKGILAKCEVQSFCHWIRILTMKAHPFCTFTFSGFHFHCHRLSWTQPLVSAGQRDRDGRRRLWYWIVNFLVPTKSGVTLGHHSAQGRGVVQDFSRFILWGGTLTVFFKRHTFFNLLFWLLMTFTVWHGGDLSVNQIDDEWGFSVSPRGADSSTKSLRCYF